MQEQVRRKASIFEKFGKASSWVLKKISNLSCVDSLQVAKIAEMIYRCRNKNSFAIIFPGIAAGISSL